MRFALYRNLLSLILLTLLFSQAMAKSTDKQALLTTVSQALHNSDQEAFRILLDPLVHAYNTASLGLTTQESIDFKNKLTTDLSKYMADTLFELRMATFSESELKAMAAHYTSPMGKSIAKKLPLIRELQNVEPLDTAASQILTKKELEYAKKFAETEMGQAIATKTKQVNQSLLTKVNSDNILKKKVEAFSKQYINQKKTIDNK